jgi:hypothetical protein
LALRCLSGLSEDTHETIGISVIWIRIGNDRYSVMRPKRIRGFFCGS